jgi:hypothetical protein
MLILENSRNWYYLQTDREGVIIDSNRYFKESFEHIQPFTIQNIIHPDDIRAAEVASLRVERLGKDSVRFFEARTIKNDGTYSWGLFEVMSVNNGFVCIGVEMFPAYEDGSGRMKRQYDLLRKINFSLNHSIRKHVANIEGLAKVIVTSEDQVARMLLQSISDLNDEVRKLVNKFDNIKKR